MRSMHSHARGHYVKLGLMVLLSFIAMYVLMYAMVDSVGHIYGSLNQAYMAGLMTAPMVPIELGLMWSMYVSRKLNFVILAASLALLAGCFLAIRLQTGVGDRQFLRSMIPHHAGAILMCRQAPVQDADIKALCRKIIAGQQQEIDQMTAKLHSFE